MDKKPEILLIDNHDSFTWNLVELLRTGCKCTVNIIRSEEAGTSDLNLYDGVVFSPGPGLPYEQPGMFRILEKAEQMAAEGHPLPVMGVCLGLQAIALHYGATLFNLPTVVHGQPCELNILRTDHFLFREIPQKAEAGLYHSWAVDAASVPSCLETLATSSDGTIMALAHRSLPVWGVQFHPESIMTPLGKQLMKNWIR